MEDDAVGSREHDPWELRVRSLDTIFLDWRGAWERVTTYLRALGLEEGEIERTGRRAVEGALGGESPEGAVRATMDRIPGLLFESHPVAGIDSFERTAGGFSRWRLAAWHAGRVSAGAIPEAAPLAPTPELLRGAMTPERVNGRRLGEGRRHRRNSATAVHADPGRPERMRDRGDWSRRGRWRRMLLGLLVGAPSVLAGLAFLGTLPGQVWLPAEVTLAVLFGALFGWISVGFWTAVFGFQVLLRGRGRLQITLDREPRQPDDSSFRTAVLMPVCDEPVERVFAGLRAMRESVARSGSADVFDWFVLSDSVSPDVIAEEEIAWAEWRRSEKEDAGVFYRRRRVRRKRKSGNVADFCRRFGRRYRYMVVLDADSLMSGETLLALVRSMETHPHVGIIQTAPRVVRGRTLFARVQQFANRLYGPLFAAGMHYWQLGDSPYWGHNAIVRVAPFMKHCGLPRLSGRPPYGGDILSHDFVEAALLGRAGWSIWLAHELPGSYEETPGSLLDEMRRDQRWCQGNLQHLRLLFTEGLVSAHRALFLNGVFSYVSAVLWLGFLTASTVEAILWAVRGPDYFADGPALFPTWPVWQPARVEALFAVVAAVLFLPKLLAVVIVMRQGAARSFGGPVAVLRGVLLESVASALFAPIRMAFYCRFVLRNLLGRAVGWKGGADDEGETTWRQSWRHHGLDATAACLWALGIYWLHPAAFWWLAPVAGALVLSLPVSVLASREALGLRARSKGWLVTPEETLPPRELQDLEARLGGEASARWSGFPGAVVDPLRNAVHLRLSRGPRSRAPSIESVRSALVDRAVHSGPDALDDREKRVLLADGGRLLELHDRVWRLKDRDQAARWGLVDTG